MFEAFTDPAKPLNERFSAHNYTVGVILSVWGMIMTAVPEGSSVAKSLAQHPTLNTILTIAQVAVMVGGAALVLSGYGVREKQRWGYYLAAACGTLFVSCGLIFFIAFRYLGTFPGLEHSVARMYWVRGNFDFIIAFVDGGFLLYFLYHQYQRDQLPPAKPDATS